MHDLLAVRLVERARYLSGIGQDAIQRQRAGERRAFDILPMTRKEVPSSWQMS